jgi:hypothetical protein
MDKQTFCSSQTTSNTSRYAAALYRQGTGLVILGLAGQGDFTQSCVWYLPLLSTRPCRVWAVWK